MSSCLTRTSPKPSWLAGCAVIAVGLSLTAPALARTHVVVGVGVGAPVVYAPPPPVYYYPPPTYYYPPPVVYSPAPPPVVYAPPPAPPALTPTAAPAPPPLQTGNCRQYRGDATIDGQNQPFFGTACQQPDGKWHIAN